MRRWRGGSPGPHPPGRQLLGWTGPEDGCERGGAGWGHPSGHNERAVEGPQCTGSGSHVQATKRLTKGRKKS